MMRERESETVSARQKEECTPAARLAALLTCMMRHGADSTRSLACTCKGKGREGKKEGVRLSQGRRAK